MLLESGGANAVRMSDIAKAAKISRQALYLHFPNRADLLFATTRHLDEVYDVQGQLAPIRTMTDGRERLAAWIEFWGNYIPKIYGVAKALIAIEDSDTEARAAWQDRQSAIREGCIGVIETLASGAVLTPSLTQQEAIDVLYSLVSVQSWETLCRDSGWPQERYVTVSKTLAAKALLAP
jgi:AcrR family transcriptional regulator